MEKVSRPGVIAFEKGLMEKKMETRTYIGIIGYISG